MDRFFDAVIKFFEEMWPWGRIDPWEVGLRVTSVPWIVDVLFSRRPGVPRMKVLPPGTHWVFPLIHDLFTVPSTEDLVNFPNQSITTLDNERLAVSGGIKYRVVDIEKLYTTVQDYEESLTNLTMGLIAEFVASESASEVTVESVRHGVRRKAQLAARKWGIQILDVIVHDLVDHKAIRLLTEDGGITL